METNERDFENVFPNGDVYVGDLKGPLPHGKGMYKWRDGTVYEGDWKAGKMTGKGRIVWPSGKTYDGDFTGNYIHGFGTVTGSDGSVYNGSWSMNSQHGIGRKLYQNSDAYEGCWKEGIRDGSGKYDWTNGNFYVGIWERGKINGRGVMKWSNGDLFDGFWLNGIRHGSGCYKFADGSFYFGTWSKGLKDGQGTLYPDGSKFVDWQKSNTEENEDKKKKVLAHSSSTISEQSVHPIIKHSVSERVSSDHLIGSARISQRSVDHGEGCCLDEYDELGSHESSFKPLRSPEGDQPDSRANEYVAYGREYMQGVLIKEWVKNIDGLSHKSKGRHKFLSKEVRKRAGVDIFEGHKSYYLMLNLQLGIRYTVSKITSVSARDVRSSDFGEKTRIRMYFPKKGSRFTPPHHAVDFSWKDYFPMVFRNLRELFKLDAADYMMSICGDDGLRELCSPGKSGSIFYLSSDDRFVIKTLKRSEIKVLLKMLPSYYRHVQAYDNTLITKFFGLHTIKLKYGKKVRFVVMGNMFFTELRIHRRYDLKGSTYGRFTKKDQIHEGTTLKDLDLKYEFHMDKLLRESLFEQLSLDSEFLESQGIIDYSLLLGLHFSAPEHLKALLEHSDPLPKLEISSDTGDHGTNSQGELSILQSGLLLVTHEPTSSSTEPGPHIRGSVLKALTVGEKEVDLLLPGTGRLRVQLGVNMPAQANSKLKHLETNSGELELFAVYDVVLYLGIIDILQEYNLKKKLEHTYKSLRLDPISISVVKPKLYSKRFINFVERVFPLHP